MAQEGYDTLMSLTDSRYRLSMIVARRAAQLKAGIPTTLDAEEAPHTTNTVTLAMKELEDGKGIVWGDDLPSGDELRRLVERRPEEPSFGVARPEPGDEE
ncbi:MAG TPA: DNA-directed RNA polymerase subunit omega [Trueperaceae bacterium]|nr:DNA-directed RNA polymerase subunit omega [Trueperaceae bacterium]